MLLRNLTKYQLRALLKQQQIMLEQKLLSIKTSWLILSMFLQSSHGSQQCSESVTSKNFDKQILGTLHSLAEELECNQVFFAK